MPNQVDLERDNGSINWEQVENIEIHLNNGRSIKMTKEELQNVNFID